jgi:putative intracellular protease/amidase
MNIVFFVFDGITALDAIGPFDVLAHLPGAKVTFAGLARGDVRTDNGHLALHADAAIAEISGADLLLVPGGLGTRRLLRDPKTLDWIRALDATTRITASVCTGALLLGAAGLLRGRRANTHFAVRERLADYGAIPVADRVVADGKYRTAAGVSAGIDLAFALVIELAGREVAERIQLAIEYAPSPPLDSGTEERAHPDVVRAVRSRVLEAERQALAALGPNPS